MKTALIGIGAMGTLFGAKLAPLTPVVMVGSWAEQLEALNEDGIYLHHPDGRVTIVPVQAASSVRHIEPVDLALILVKSRQTERAALLAAQILAPHGMALTLQNGLGNIEKLRTVLGADRAALGVTAEGATMMKPGHVRHAGHGPTHLAQTPDTCDRLESAARLFTQAGFETHLADDVDSLVWGKLAVNAGINPLTALLRVPNGFLAEQEQARALMMAAAQETAAVAAAMGIRLPYADAAQRALEVARATASNHSSMLQDTLRGIQTEINAISGQIMAHGRRLQVPTPVNASLYEYIVAVENQRGLPLVTPDSPLFPLRSLLSGATAGAVHDSHRKY